MSFIARLQRARETLEQQGRLSRRALERELGIGGDELDEIIEELVDVQRVARREERILVWTGASRPTRDVRRSPVGNPSDPLTANSLNRPDDAEARKVVTIVFADLIGSTSLHERLDPESVSRLMDRYHRAVRAPVEAHGGTVVQLLGDGVMCAFGVPRVAEDDAIRAVRAAVEIVEAVRELAVTLPGEGSSVGSPTANGPTTNNLSVRVAVNTGEVVVSDEHAAGIGDPLNVAARLQQEARDGDVLVGEATERLLRELVTLERVGTFALKGRSETVTAYRVLSLDRPAGAAATAFVGRDDELRRITAVYDAAVGAPGARLAVILGTPGLGKSRLLDEFGRRRADRAIVLNARCDAAGTATFAPIAEALRAFLRPGGDASGRTPPPGGPRVERAPVPLLTQEGSGEVGMPRIRPPPGPRFGKEGEARGGALRQHAGDEPLRTAIATVLSNDTSAEGLPTGDADRGRIAAGLGALLVGTPASPEETFFVIRRFLAALATTQPVVLAIDDLQWAEPLLLDLIEHLMQWGAGAPLLVLAAARPELRDVRSSMAQPGGMVGEVVTLSGLDAAAATRLAASVIGAEALPAAVVGRVLATSEGNPLFVGELVRMLVQDGALKREEDRWTAGIELSALEMPPTIQALLAARIERLGAEERTVLERAAVVGRRFSRAAVAHLLPVELRARLDTRFEALRRSELIEPDTAWFLGEPALRFHHGLTRDAAYRRVLKGTRAELHGRLADWFEDRVGQAVEHDETIGWHLEQAHRHLSELGPLDAQGRAFGERASHYLAAAGRRALAGDDLPVAANLLGRALDRLDVHDPTRADLALDWCEALLAAGDVGPAAKAIEELGRWIGPMGPMGPMGQMGPIRLRAWHTCFAGQLAVLTDPQALHATAGAVASAAADLAAAGDDAGEAKAHLVHALALSRLGKIGACEVELDKALAAARRVDDRRRSNTVLANAPLAALWGPSPVTRASGRCLDVVRVLRITQGAPAVEAVALRCQAVLEALRGRTDAARRMIASARRMVEELGITQQLLEADVFAGLIDLLEGDAVTAERSLRSAYGDLRQHGLGIDAARAAAFLGRSLLVQGRAAEAEAVSRESEALAGDDLQAAITWRGVRAEALATRGKHTGAVDFARAAVDLAATTDALLLHADARSALAAALLAAGRHAEAAAEEALAIELWEAKGATLLAGRARPGAGRAREAQPMPARGDERARGELRRVRENGATNHLARLSAAIAARDVEALPVLIADDAEVVHQPTRSVHGAEEMLRIWRATTEAPGGTIAFDSLATLGDSLALCRQLISASGAAGEKFDIGPYEVDLIALVEVDRQGRRRRSEFFAADRLVDAVARLYERYAELLPEGHEHERAATTARAVALGLPFPHADRYDQIVSAGFETVDHRSMGMMGNARGVERNLRAFRSILELTDDFAVSIDDVLALDGNAFVLRLTSSGTSRIGGGTFGREFIALVLFGSDGLMQSMEWFDADRDTEALARFDELTAHTPPRSTVEPSPPAVKRERRVQPNAATANAGHFGAMITARDTDVLPSLFAVGFEVIDHTTGTTYDLQGSLRGWRSMFRAEDLTHGHEPLATLGESLALVRQRVSASAMVSRKFDVGAYEIENILLVEADSPGQRQRTEVFAAGRLGDAIVRLYQRYADLLPEGPERDRAAATARSVAALPLVGPHNLNRFDPTTFAPSFEYVDHRTIGMGTVHGWEALRKNIGALVDLLEVSTARTDDVLALQPNGFLFHWTHFGTDRAGGGTFERRLCHLWVFGSDGLFARGEQFDAEREEEALARFEELVAEPPAERCARRRPRPNAATVNTDRTDAAIAARDTETLADVLRDDYSWLDRTTGAEIDKQGLLATWRGLLRAQNPKQRHEPLAALGDSLALCRLSSSASAYTGRRLDVGPYEREEILVIEVDAEGRRRRDETFATDHLDDAVVLLYERHAGLLPEGPERERAAATARSVSATQGLWQLDRAPVLAPSVEVVDHRILGTWSAAGARATMDHFRSVLEVADNVATRFDEVLGLEAAALLVRATHSGTARAGGGLYERQFLMLIVFGSDGLVTRSEYFDAESEGDARARFDELVSSGPEGVATKPPAARIENAATRSADRFAAGWAARDWQGIAVLFTPDFRLIDRRSYARLDLDRAQHLESLRFRFELPSSQTALKVLATRGHRLALLRNRFELAGRDVGPSETESLIVAESDERGRFVVLVTFDPDDLDTAYAELDERYVTGEAAPHERSSEIVRRFAPPGSGSRKGRGNAANRAREVGWWVGSHAAGDPLAALAKSNPDPLRIPPNAATRAYERRMETSVAGDWEALEALCAPTLVHEDRRRLVRTTFDREMFIAHCKFAAAGLAVGTVRATAGDSLALVHLCWSDGRDRPLYEIEQLTIYEADTEGRLAAVIVFDPEDRRGAAMEMLERYARSAAGRWMSPKGVEFRRALLQGDLERLRALLPGDFTFHDHRRTGGGRFERTDDYIAWLAALFELSPDAIIEPLYYIAAEPHAFLGVGHTIGTLADGGEFESVFLQLGIHRDDRLTGAELFEIEDLDAARVRFEELRG